MMGFKRRRFEDEKILDFFRQAPCIVCSRGSDPCHIRSRGSGGGDEEWNLIPLCREHHQVQHKIGWVRFCKKNPGVARVLDQNGWKFIFEGDPKNGVIKLRRDSVEADEDNT